MKTYLYLLCNTDFPIDMLVLYLFLILQSLQTNIAHWEGYLYRN